MEDLYNKIHYLDNKYQVVAGKLRKDNKKQTLIPKSKDGCIFVCKIKR